MNLKFVSKTVPVLAAIFWLFSGPALAKVDLTTLTDRDQVQLTIYNSADLTLVRDSRFLNFNPGMNQIQFSWAGTRIDPTSLTLEILSSDAPATVTQMSFPPQAKDLGIWYIQADKACRARVDITYFTSGISWQAFYTAVLSEDETAMGLKGYVRVDNQSGEDYPNAKTRLVVGKINLLDEIAFLARRTYPYGAPQKAVPVQEVRAAYKEAARMMEALPSVGMDSEEIAARPKEIVKQGLSEYFLYTVEGQETIPSGWAKQLLSFDALKVAVENVYQYEEERYGDQVVRKLKFTNDEPSGLGAVPLPAGEVNVYQSVDRQGGMAFAGSAPMKYLPLGKPSELDLGPSERVSVKPVAMGYEKKNIIFDEDKDLSGFDEIRDMEIQTANFSDTRARIEITRNMGDPHFKLDKITFKGKFEKIDQDSFKFELLLDPGQKETIRYQLTRFAGERKWKQ